MNDTIISLNGITKEFRIPRRKEATVLSHMTSRIVGREIQRPHTVTALHDVSLNVQAREVVGIVGDNAAGKSTLLRVIAGIVHPTSGHVTVRGNVTSLISMSVSLRKTLTVKDNIFLAASCFGMTRAQTVRCFQDILEFGGLTDYVDMFPYQISDGMNQRLDFSIEINANSDILLI
ncbi:MAG: ABC transporter ATP-binding protein, partial [Candidatus Peregrinibacteria bacterium]|nr:ABC transporter ATP-binding protein [Candidatus Peregrinibacteria bacterium]